MMKRNHFILTWAHEGFAYETPHGWLTSEGSDRGGPTRGFFNHYKEFYKEQNSFWLVNLQISF